MNLSGDVRFVAASGEVQAVLVELCDLTGMGFAAVARVTDQRWVACQVLDKIEFGLAAGDELEINTTICDEIRASGKEVIIDCVDDAPMWRTHPTPILYGFQSYVSLPLWTSDGSFFGTLCAIDPRPHSISTPNMQAAMHVLAARVTAVLEQLP